MMTLNQQKNTGFNSCPKLDSTLGLLGSMPQHISPGNVFLGTIHIICYEKKQQKSHNRVLTPH
jgi:hypothetical protein